ncbi:MAG: DUF421 domain-containing protein [Pseudomonadota bacterium]|nr:DUF421 domain-containing protein [Pseudomonadota bacterium]
MPTQEYAFDLSRIFSATFTRCFWWRFFYGAPSCVYALVVVRVLGKRGLGQLAPFDFVIIIALGSAVGDLMFYPNVPLLHAMVAITVIVVYTRGVVRLTEHSRKLKDFVASTTTRMVIDGRMDLAGMEEESMSRSELFQSLRMAGIEQLGEVERAYLEPSGKLTSFPFAPGRTRTGLALLPPCEENWPAPLEENSVVPDSKDYCCWRAAR